jgi:hypothetical protein
MRLAKSRFLDRGDGSAGNRLWRHIHNNYPIHRSIADFYDCDGFYIVGCVIYDLPNAWVIFRDRLSVYVTVLPKSTYRTWLSGNSLNPYWKCGRFGSYFSE